MPRSTQRSDASADPAKLSNVQMMAAAGRHGDFSGDLHENGSPRFQHRRRTDWTAGEMTVQANFGHNANFSLQQGLVRLVGHLAAR